jgi:hypothetical protein
MVIGVRSVATVAQTVGDTSFWCCACVVIAVVFDFHL